MSSGSKKPNIFSEFLRFLELQHAPILLAIALVPIVFTTRTIGWFTPYWILIISIFFLALVLFKINELCDVEADKLSHPGRSLAAGKVTVPHGIIFTIFLYIAAVISGYVFKPATALLETVLAALLLGGGLMKKMRRQPPMLPAMINASAATGVLFIIFFSIDALERVSILFLASFYCMEMAFCFISSIQDYPGDAAFNIKTPASVLGFGASAWIAFILNLPAVVIWNYLIVQLVTVPAIALAEVVMLDVFFGYVFWRIFRFVRTQESIDTLSRLQYLAANGFLLIMPLSRLLPS